MKVDFDHMLKRLKSRFNHSSITSLSQGKINYRRALEIFLRMNKFWHGLMARSQKLSFKTQDLSLPWGCCEKQRYPHQSLVTGMKPFNS